MACHHGHVEITASEIRSSVWHFNNFIDRAVFVLKKEILNSVWVEGQYLPDKKAAVTLSGPVSDSDK